VYQALSVCGAASELRTWQPALILRRSRRVASSSGRDNRFDQELVKKWHCHRRLARFVRPQQL